MSVISHEIFHIFFHHSTIIILIIPSVMIYECCNLSPLQMLQNSFVLSALNAILLLCSLRQFMKNNAVAGMSTFLSKNRKLRLAYPQYNGLTIIIAETPNATDIFLLPHISSLYCGIRVRHSIRSMFRVLGIYNFGLRYINKMSFHFQNLFLFQNELSFSNVLPFSKYVSFAKLATWTLGCSLTGGPIFVSWPSLLFFRTICTYMFKHGNCIVFPWAKTDNAHC